MDNNNQDLEFVTQNVNNDIFDDDTINESPTPDQEPENQEDQEEKEKRKKIIIISCISVVVALLLVYIWGIFYFKSHFLPNTQVNAIDVGWKTPDKALGIIDEGYANRTVKIISEVGMASVTGEDIDLDFNNNLDQLVELVDQQNTFIWPLQLVSTKEKDLASDYEVNEQKLTNVVDNLNIVTSPQIVAPKNATIEYNGTEFVIDPSVDGDQPNIDKLKNAIVYALVVGDSTIDMETANLYNLPTVTTNDSTLQELLKEYNIAVDASITLTFPSQNVILNKDTFHDWLQTSSDNTVIVNQDSLASYVAGLAGQFNTAGRDLAFKANNGNTYYFTDNGGWILDQSAEITELNDQILAGSVVTEEPKWSQTGSNYITGDSISGTYIEVSLASQQLWYYKNGALVASTTIVSGDTSQGLSTSTGLYFLLSKNTNTTLNVRYPDGSMNNVKVNYWLPYTQDYSIESASFRTDFGGDIYRTQGTDGDIDVPDSAAQTLYTNCDVGTPVVIY